MVTQIWIGGYDAAGMLASIGGWQVECYNHKEQREAVEWAERNQYVTRRTHYAPAIPEGSEAFELTDVGLAALGKWYGEKAESEARKMRQWYRDNSARPPEKSVA